MTRALLSCPTLFFSSIFFRCYVQYVVFMRRTAEILSVKALTHLLTLLIFKNRFELCRVERLEKLTLTHRKHLTYCTREKVTLRRLYPERQNRGPKNHALRNPLTHKNDATTLAGYAKTVIYTRRKYLCAYGKHSSYTFDISENIFFLRHLLVCLSVRPKGGRKQN